MIHGREDRPAGEKARRRRAPARTANPPAADGAPDRALGARLRHALPDRPRPAGDARRRA